MGCRDRIRSQLWYNNPDGVQIETRWLPTVYIWGSHPTKKILKKRWIKTDKMTNKDRAFGHWPLLCNDLGVCGGRQRQALNKCTHNVCHDSSESVFYTDCNGMRHFSKTNGVRERWIFIIKSLHWCATCQLLLVVLKSQVPNDLISKQNMGATPHKAIGVGSLTTIHRASKCLPQVVWYLQCIQMTNMNALIRKKPEDCNSKWWT